jgi:uncharacterized caspase-like protein
MPSSTCRLIFSIGLLVVLDVGGLPVLHAQSTPPPPRDLTVETAPHAPSQLKYGTYRALVIGIDNYENFVKLETPQNDANEIADLLQKRYGFIEVKRLPDATNDQIIGALNGYTKLTQDDNLLIYFAGHGFFDKDKDEAYWLPVDAKSDRARWIIAPEITSTLKAIPARHVLVISDSCYSGMLDRDVTLTDNTSDDSVSAELLQRKSRHLLSSGADEPVADGGCPNHSVFACALLDWLTNNKKPRLPTEELFLEVQRTVAGKSKQMPQYKPIRDSNDDGGAFVFVQSDRDQKSPPGPRDVHYRLPPPDPRRLAINVALDDFEVAYRSMDIHKLKQVWPSMTSEQANATQKAWDNCQLKAVEVQLRDRIFVEVDNSTAKVRADRWRVYTYKHTQTPPQSNLVEIVLSKNAQGAWVVSDMNGK